MSTGQTLLSIGALILLSQILVTFYRLSAETGQTLDNAQGGITALTLATSYMELANRLEFDDITRSDTIYTGTGGLTLLTPPNLLGREPGEFSMKDHGRDAMYAFNDIDDFNRDTLDEIQVGGRNVNFQSAFRVVYVDMSAPMDSATTQTPMKRIDMVIWRTFPSSGDTLRASMFVGYWKFRI